MRYAHWLLSHAWAWRRDAERMRDAARRADLCPLGSGALAGNALGVDRARLAQELKFQGVTPNSMDAVAERDFVAELVFALTLFETHVSRFAEDLIFYATRKFVIMSDAYW